MRNSSLTGLGRPAAFRVRSCSLLLLLAGCAPQLIIPPVRSDPQWQVAADSAVHVRPPTSAQKVETDTDAGVVRRRVTTHKGIYTGWVQKPQLTFYMQSDAHGSPGRTPTVAGLIARVLEPDALQTTQLFFQCPDLRDSTGMVMTSRVLPTGSTQSHFLNYLIPIEPVARFANCSSGTLTIGQISVPFNQEQLDKLRTLLLASGAKE